jgi:hypothetical protein
MIMEVVKNDSELTDDNLQPKGCRIGCLSMLGIFTVILLLVLIGSSPRNYMTFQKYRPDKKDNIIEQETGIAFPPFKLVDKDIYDDGIISGMFSYNGELEFYEVPGDEFYHKLDSLCDLGIITGKARHENRKAWKHYGNTYGSQVHELYEFKHIIRNMRSENRILTYKIEIEKGQKNWRVKIKEGYKGEFSDSDKEI